MILWAVWQWNAKGPENIHKSHATLVKWLSACHKSNTSPSFRYSKAATPLLPPMDEVKFLSWRKKIAKEAADVFLFLESAQDKVGEVGTKLFITLYGGKTCDDLIDLQ